MFFVQTIHTQAKAARMLTLCCLLSGQALAQAPKPPPSGLWQLSAGWQHYSERQMQLSGPELGLHWQSPHEGALRLEAEAVFGLQKYSSTQMGTLAHVPNIDTRWRVLQTSQAWPQWQYGLALHTHFNHLRGTTSLGFAGYDRLSTQIWLPVRWQSLGDQPWAVEAGWLLRGEHVTRLSQVNANLQDVRNTQRQGVYLQASTTLKTSMGELQPYARWSRVGDSDIRLLDVSGARVGAYEPQNTRWQLGVRWDMR